MFIGIRFIVYDNNHVGDRGSGRINSNTTTTVVSKKIRAEALLVYVNVTVTVLLPGGRGPGGQPDGRL